MPDFYSFASQIKSSFLFNNYSVFLSSVSTVEVYPLRTIRNKFKDFFKYDGLPRFLLLFVCPFGERVSTMKC